MHDFALEDNNLSTVDRDGKYHAVNFQANQRIRGDKFGGCNETGLHKPFGAAPGKQGAVVVEIFAFYQVVDGNC